MYYIVMEGHNYYYEIYEMLTLYYPYEKMSACSRKELPDNCKFLISSISIGESNVSSVCTMGIIADGQWSENSRICRSFKGEVTDKVIKDAVKVTAFEVLKNVTGIEMPWGILVGIRPSKIVSEMKDKDCTIQKIEETLKDRYFVRDDRIKLIEEVSKNSYDLINNDPKKISIYIGIPFCPTRCLYCSFASYPISKYSAIIEDYLKSLIREMEILSPFIKSHFCVENIYIGGGTPTSIDDDSFRRLLSAVKNNFFTENLKEFTVEAGRPDTINRSKLKSMRDYNVDRISINPQTMNDDTLKRVGRSHTVKDIIDVFNLSRDMGFNDINMDIIIGLPGENISHVKRTIEKLLELSPECITVHSMAVKRASRLKEEINKHEDIPSIGFAEAWEAMDYVQQTLYAENYLPYYMYRQKMMVGNLENIGYCKKGYRCSYNIQEIEEKQTIIGFGADAVTKAVFFDTNRIERFANKKDLTGYIDTIEESSNKKLEFLRVLTSAC